MKNRHKYLTTVLIFVFVTTFIACVLVLTNFIKQPTSYPDANNQSELNKVIGEQYLFTEIPNFDRLNLEDLPNISDNLVGRSAIIFNENLILSSGNKILEYNPKIKQFIRVSNKILPDISKPAIIGDNLYVAGGNLDKKERDWPGKSVIYTIDLKTGKIIKVLLSKDPRNFANLNIVARDGYLWAGSLDGTFKINPDNDTLTALTIKDDFYNPYLNFENGTLVAYDRGNRFEYDNGSQVWNEKTVNQSTYTLENNLDEDEIFNNLKLKLPSFSSISPIIRNKYYLFSDKGIFTLERGRFPKQVIEGKIEENEYFTERLFVTEDEKHALAIRKKSFAGDSLHLNPIIISIYYIELEEKKIYDLIGKNFRFAGFDNEITKKFNFETGISIKETQDGIFIISIALGKEIAKVDFKTKSLITF